MSKQLEAVVEEVLRLDTLLCNYRPTEYSFTSIDNDQNVYAALCCNSAPALAEGLRDAWRERDDMKATAEQLGKAAVFNSERADRLLAEKDEWKAKFEEADTRHVRFMVAGGPVVMAAEYDNLAVERNELGTQAARLLAENQRLREALSVADQQRDEAKKDAESWKRHWEMYRDAWVRELGGWLIPKHHEIDSLVLTTRKRCVNPLLGNCRAPHWLGAPTADRKGLQQTTHPQDASCRDWEVDDSEPNPRAALAQSGEKEESRG